MPAYRPTGYVLAVEQIRGGAAGGEGQEGTISLQGSAPGGNATLETVF